MAVKNQIKHLLDNKEFKQIAEMSEGHSRVIRYLFSFLYSTDDLLHWRAAEALGEVANFQASKGIDEGRNIPRRLLWSLAEESGATAFPAPEAIGAVAAKKPNSFPDFGRIVMSFIDDPGLCRGVLWSARKIAETRPDLVRHSTQKIIELLKDPNPTIRGHAAWALGAIRDQDALVELKKLQDDSATLYIYSEGDLQAKTVGELAGEAILEISGAKI